MDRELAESVGLINVALCASWFTRGKAVPGHCPCTVSREPDHRRSPARSLMTVCVLWGRTGVGKRGIKATSASFCIIYACLAAFGYGVRIATLRGRGATALRPSSMRSRHSEGSLRLLVAPRPIVDVL